MPNQHYSIFVAQDNLQEVICGFSSLYFNIVTDKVSICDHNFSLLQDNNQQKRSYLNANTIVLDKKTIEKIMQKALMLQNKKLDKGEDFVVSFGKDASFTAIFSLFY